MGTVIVTLGERGALIVNRDGERHIPALSIEAVDVTGAGDSFNAALAVFLGESLSIDDAGRGGRSYPGAYTAMHIGVIDSLPSPRGIRAFRVRERVADQSSRAARRQR